MHALRLDIHFTDLHTIQDGMETLVMARLEKSDWLEHGISVLKTEGATGLKLEAMVRALNVTRGSFYWHFKNIEVFKRELLEAWRLRINEVQIAELGQLQNSAHQIGELVHRVLTQPQDLEAAIRAWAGADRHVAKTVQTIDQMRLDFLIDAFCGLGVEREAAIARATLMHWAYVGRAVAPHHDEETLAKLAPVLSGILAKA